MKALGLGEKWGRSGEKRRRDKKNIGATGKKRRRKEKALLGKRVFFVFPSLPSLYSTVQLCVLAIHSTLVRTKA